MNENDRNGRSGKTRSTGSYQSTKLNKKKQMRQNAELKMDMAYRGQKAKNPSQERRSEPERRSSVQGSAQRRKVTQQTAQRQAAARQNSSGRVNAGRNNMEPSGTRINQTRIDTAKTAQRPHTREQMMRDKRARERYLRRRRRALCTQLALLAFSIVLLAGIVVLIKKAVIKHETVEVEANVEEEIQSVLGNVTDDSVEISKYYVYGTHFNLEGHIGTTKELKTLELVMVDDKKGLAVGQDSEEEMEKIYQLVKTIGEDGSYYFKTAENINEGINLENIDDGNYCLLLKLLYADGTKEYKSLKDAVGEQAITYYTLTESGKNQKIDIAFAQDDKGTNLSYLGMQVKKSKLPDDVYDIVIDAGHGGKDPGADKNGYTEAELTLPYAKAIKESLEDKGYKVQLTRDGSESSSEDMAYTMYDEDGRVSIACRSGAKYGISIHLNSNAEALTSGGVQVYCSVHGNPDFAKLIADGIVTDGNTNYSSMESDRVANGVYASPYSQNGVAKSTATAQKYGYTPYDYTGVDSLFMIRELGGIATGALVDGRDPRYGTNEYRNSNVGVESVLVELGYISIKSDLQNIISNQKGYVKGIAEAVEKQIEQQKKL